MYGNPELRSYGKPDFRPALNPRRRKNPFPDQRNMYGNPELRSYGKPDFRPVLNPRRRKNPFPESERGFDNTRNRTISHPGLLPDVAFLTRTIDLINNKTLEKKTIRANRSLAS